MAYVTLGGIVGFLMDEKNALVKVEHAVESNPVVVVPQDPESGTLQGDMQAIQRDKTYEVNVCLFVSFSYFTRP